MMRPPGHRHLHDANEVLNRAVAEFFYRHIGPLAPGRNMVKGDFPVSIQCLQVPNLEPLAQP